MKQYNEVDVDQFIGGEPGQTNWPDYGLVKRKDRHAEFFAVDVDGVTVATADNGASATTTGRYYQAQGKVVEVRRVVLKESDFQHAETKRKKEFWEDFLYKPTRRKQNATK